MYSYDFHQSHNCTYQKKKIIYILGSTLKQLLSPVQYKNLCASNNTVNITSFSELYNTNYFIQRLKKKHLQKYVLTTSDEFST